MPFPQPLEAAIAEIQAIDDLNIYASDPRNADTIQRWKDAFHADYGNFQPELLTQPEKVRLLDVTFKARGVGIDLKIPNREDVSEQKSAAPEENKEDSENRKNLKAQFAELLEPAFRVLTRGVTELEGRDDQKSLDRIKDLSRCIKELTQIIDTVATENVKGNVDVQKSLGMLIPLAQQVLETEALNQNKYSKSNKFGVFSGAVNAVVHHGSQYTTDIGKTLHNASVALQEKLEQSRKHTI